MIQRDRRAPVSRPGDVRWDDVEASAAALEAASPPPPPGGRRTVPLDNTVPDKWHDRLVTGSFRAGKFRHELPVKFADLCDDVSKLVRSSGSSGIHMARVLSTPVGDDPSADDVLEGRRNAHKLANLVDTLDAAWHVLYQLHVQITDLNAHATGESSYEDNGCASCKRNAGHWEEVQQGHRLCRWCRSFKESYRGKLPPLPILKAHHQGQRITTGLVLRLCPELGVA